MKKESIDRLLEVARERGRGVESAVASIKDPYVRGAVAGVIMQRIMQEADSDEASASTAASASIASNASASALRKSGTQARILDLRDEKFFAEPRRLEQVLEELRIRGYHHNKSDVRMSLLRLARKKLLRRIPLGEGRQRTYLYVNP